MFSDTQKKALAAPLDRKNVKTRSQSGRELSYIEGWKAIEEANRIFGFDGWDRETVELRCVAEGPRKLKSGDGFSATYIAKVRVTVGGIVRDGCGTGHGMDRDLGAAHESALKEAETDAMKRAMMTFGYPFGLALYDKTQEHVGDGTPVPDEEWGSRDGVNVYRILTHILKNHVTQASDVFQFRQDNAGMIANLPVKMQAHLNKELDRIGAAIIGEDQQQDAAE